MKFYFVRFTHNKTNKIFYKFGVTSKSDVLERFNTKYDSRYAEFNIKVMYSAWGSEEQVLKLEKSFLEKFPKNFILETYLGESYGYYNKLSGITETCLLDDKQVDKIIRLLLKLKDRDNFLVYFK